MAVAFQYIALTFAFWSLGVWGLTIDKSRQPAVAPRVVPRMVPQQQLPQQQPHQPHQKQQQQQQQQRQQLAGPQPRAAPVAPVMSAALRQPAAPVAATARQPVKALQQPVKALQQRVNGPQQRVTVQQQPVTAPQQPVTVQQQPVTAPQQPVRVQQQRVKALQQPVKGPQQPVTAPRQPVKALQQPATVKQQPVKALQQPVTVQQQPVTAPQQPVTVQQQPVKGLQQPVNGPQQPVTAPQQPVTAPQPPALAAQADSDSAQSGTKEEAIVDADAEDTLTRIEESLSTVSNFVKGELEQNECPEGLEMLPDRWACREAADALGLPWHGQIYKPESPGNCSEDSGKVYFNLHPGAPQNTSTPICASLTKRHKDVEPVGEPLYIFMNGPGKSCKKPLTTKEECDKAATALALVANFSRDSSTVASETLPGGCVFVGPNGPLEDVGFLSVNSEDSEGKCMYDNWCICDKALEHEEEN